MIDGEGGALKEIGNRRLYKAKVSQRNDQGGQKKKWNGFVLFQRLSKIKKASMKRSVERSWIFVEMPGRL